MASQLLIDVTGEGVQRLRWREDKNRWKGEWAKDDMLVPVLQVGTLDEIRKEVLYFFERTIETRRRWFAPPREKGRPSTC